MLSKALPLLLISWLSLAGAGCLTLDTPSQPEPKPLGQILNQQSSEPSIDQTQPCLLYTSDAADDLLCVDLGGRRIIKKKNTKIQKKQPL